ncbi:carbohydrate ABC transporter permease [Phytoactinopolyspora endophytica]|uniref:carbohydrate ABC transporter permease n=1 Tax=Phytoactinopolyspora endophytica TaxID=1642495 RepID=UPI00101D4DA1|nr:carbohydrate ABC transporter permease [Phytoactinopolyspora endophytica]
MKGQDVATTGRNTARAHRHTVANFVKKAPRSLVWLLVAANIAVLVFMVLASFKTSGEIFDSPWSLPEEWNLDNWTEAWVTSGFGQAARNTVIVVAAASVSVIALSAPAAYVLSRSQSRMASGLTVAFVMGIGIPSQVLVIPIFVMLAEVGLVNSLPGLYFVYTALGLPFSVFLLTGFFRSLPSELEEAALLDGAGPLRTFFRVMLPLARSGIITALTLTILSLWNETLMALVLLQETANYTLSVALLAFLSTVQYGSGSYGALLAGACIVVLPTLAVYIWLGRRLIEGISLGSGK